MIDYNILIDRFLNITDVIGNPDEGYKYDAINHFQSNWNLESPDFHTMFRIAFAKRENLFYQNSWGFIDKCAEHFPEITRIMFRDLYDENIDIEIRICNFQNKADELLDQLKSQLNRDNLNAQQDERTISVYLGFRYPEKYIFYMFSFYGRLALEFKIIGDFREKKNYLKLLSFLPDLKNAVQERKDFVERYRSFYPAPGWDDTNLMIQNILYVGYRFDLDGIHDGSLLHFSKDELLNYYQVLDKLIQRFTLQKKDYRVVFNESEKQLNFTVGQKYVWCLKSKNKVNRYRAIGNENFGQSIEIFNSESNKFLNDTDDFNLINKNFDLIASAIGNELEKTKKSGYYKFNSEFFERMAFDKEFRTLILEKVVAENDDVHYYLIGEYEEWYFKKYGKRLDSFIYAMIYGFLYQLEEQEIVSKYELEHYNHSTILCLINQIPNFKYDGLDTFELFLQELLQKTNMKTNPLNQILYGPPGTGKTYNTINKAISIANPEFNLEQDRDIVKKEYDRLVEAGQIVFTTFHQSMSYEDFVEGIKPQTKNEQVTYSVEEGLFKSLVKKALIEYLDKDDEVSESDDFDSIYTSYINSIKDFENKREGIFTTKTGVEIMLIDANENSILVKYLWSNKNKTEEGQHTFSVTKEKLKKVLLEGIEPDKVKSLKAELHPIVGHIHCELFAVYKSFYEFVIANKGEIETIHFNYEDQSYEEIKDQFDALDKQSLQNKNVKKYVLIIDEINRGNVSQIFGELITLIEESKRLDADESLEVKLPYSKKEFGVPSNFYIIGTMNTADRSVEALDTALRRRFTFEEMLPKPFLLKDKNIGTVNLEEVLTIINKRIEVLLDRDHTIGHSYFINVKNENDLRNTFKNNIIPLLQEYFYGDYEKIGMVLGMEFFEEFEKFDNSLFAKFQTENYPQGGRFFRLKTINQGFEIIKAIQILMNKKVEETNV